MDFQQVIHFFMQRCQIGYDRLELGNACSARDTLHNGAEPPPQASPVARHVFLDGRLDQLVDVSAVQRNPLPHKPERSVVGADPLGGRLELVSAGQQRRQREAKCLLDIPSPALARVTLAVRAVPTDDQPAVHKSRQVPPDVWHQASRGL